MERGGRAPFLEGIPGLVSYQGNPKDHPTQFGWGPVRLVRFADRFDAEVPPDGSLQESLDGETLDAAQVVVRAYDVSLAAIRVPLFDHG